jgi:Domain of unknown function (DUF3291)
LNAGKEHFLVPSFHLAQINIAQARYPLDDPRMAEFVDNLERINNLAVQMPGYIWRLKDDSGNATNIRLHDDPLIIVNMSVWQDTESLEKFAYKTIHIRFIKKRLDWFNPSSKPYLALWWIRQGHEPTIEEGTEKLELLARTGPGPEAFNFNRLFTHTGEALETIKPD